VPLPRLLPAPQQVQVQETAFTTDALSRFICSTWEEATGNGGQPFSVVIVGAGAYGAYLAAKVFRRRPNKRILLLDAGSWLVSEHVQNLGRVGFDGSSDLSMGWRSSVWSPSVCREHDPQPIVIKILESVGQAADVFNDQVDGFGAAVGNP
jgi:hypothetical protein